MIPLETRIESEGAAAAAEIAPTDIPALRLPPVRNRRAALMRPGAPPERRRRLAPLAAAAAVAAVLAALVAVGHAPWTRHSGTWPESAAVGHAQQLLAKEALDAYFPATGAQYTAGLVFEWTRQKILAKDTGPCLAAAGFARVPFSEPQRQFVLSAPDNGQFPDLAQRARTHFMTPHGFAIGRHQPIMPAARQHAYAVAALACMIKFAYPIRRLDIVAKPVAGLWLKKVTSIQASAPVQAKQHAFVSCLEDFGIPAPYATARGTGGQQLFDAFFTWMDRLGDATTSPAQFIYQQRLWTPVFVTCARPTVTTMERIQIAARKKFFLAHAGQIGAIKRIVVGLLPGRRP
jgi:hypothetical protein